MRPTCLQTLSCSNVNVNVKGPQGPEVLPVKGSYGAEPKLDSGLEMPSRLCVWLCCFPGDLWPEPGATSLSHLQSS